MGNAFKTGKSQAKRQAKQQKEQLRLQRQDEQRKAANAEDEIARRKAVATKGGMRSTLLAGGSESGGSTSTSTGASPASTNLLGG